MWLFLLFNIWGLFFLGSVSAENQWRSRLKLRHDDPYFESCKTVVSTLYSFQYISPMGNAHQEWDVSCEYPPAIESILLCGNKLVSSSKFDTFVHSMTYNCDRYSSFQKDLSYYFSQGQNASKYVSKYGYWNDLHEVYGPVDVNMTTVNILTKSYRSLNRAEDNGTYYSIGLFCYIGFIVLLGAINTLFDRVRLNRNSHGPLINFIRSHLVLPSLLVDGRCASPYRWKFFSWIVPSRIETLSLLGFLIMQITFWCLPHNSAESESLFHSKLQAWRKVIAARSAIMATCKIPLVILLAGRNNFLAWISGLRYSFFIQLHKFIGKMMIIDAIIHSVAISFEIDSYSVEAKKFYFRAGIAATILGSFMWIFSLYPLRKFKYECFLYSHIMLAIGFIVMCWYHCNILGWCEWIIAACCIWVADRLLRICRMVTFGARKAQLTLIHDSIIKVVVKPPKCFTCRPGQYGFVYFADSLLWFENHPFSMILNGENIELFVKVRNGITKKLCHELKKHDDCMTKCISIEGAYGTTIPIDNYQNLLFIAGGTGLSSLISYINESMKYKDCIIRVIVIDRNLEQVKCYLESFRRRWSNAGIKLEFFFTRPKNEWPSEDMKFIKSSSSSEESIDEKSCYSTISLAQLGEVNFGRPGIDELLKKELAIMKVGSICVMSCGPDSMMDQMRASISKIVTQANRRIEYVCTYQKW